MVFGHLKFPTGLHSLDSLNILSSFSVKKASRIFLSYPREHGTLLSCPLFQSQKQAEYFYAILGNIERFYLLFSLIKENHILFLKPFS